MKAVLRSRLGRVAAVVVAALTIGLVVPSGGLPVGSTGVAHAVFDPTTRDWAPPATVVSPVLPPGTSTYPKAPNLYWVDIQGHVAPLYRLTGNIFIEPFDGFEYLAKGTMPLINDVSGAQEYYDETRKIVQSMYKS